MSESRSYPHCCRSAVCGKSGEACATCPRLPIKREFEAWVASTRAVVADPVWSPCVYVAQGKEGSR